MTTFRDDVQDTIHPRVAPIPPYEGRRTSESGPRYVRTEPMPSPAPQAQFGQPAFGFTYPGAGFAPVLLRRKSVLLAGVLGLLLGPLGLVYSSLLGAFLLSGPALITLIVGGSDALGGIVLLSALWGMWAAHRRNERVRFLEAAYRR